MPRKPVRRRPARPKTRRSAPSAAVRGPRMPGEYELLARLSNAVGVSGAEGEVRQIILDLIRRLADDITVDALGNIIAMKKGSRRERVLVTAHMDEVGFMVTGFDSDGALRFEPLGYVSVNLKADPDASLDFRDSVTLNEFSLAGRAVTVGPNHVPGVIGAPPVHLAARDRRNVPLKSRDLRIDLGVESEAAARQLVKLGDRGTFATSFAVVGPSLRGKALDNRLGCASLIELLRGKAYPFDLYAAFTVQEEIGLRGARVAAYAVDPVAAFNLDATPANDLPHSAGRENTQYNTRLGHGPAIYVADKGTLYHPGFVRYLRETAEGAGIPYQLRQPGGGGTDAGAIHTTREGIPTISVSVPHRYTHSPISLARADDWRNSIRLIRRALDGFSAKALRR